VVFCGRRRRNVAGCPTVGVIVNDIAQLLQHPDTTVAVVGATDDPGKYGSVIYRDLKAKGFTVYPVNPNRVTVDGDPAYASLAALPEPPTILNLVVPPEQTLRVLEAAKREGLMNVWVQPGAGNGDVLAYLDEHDFTYLANACIMVRSRHLEPQA
jgi:predicted CoA-binding protein